MQRRHLMLAGAALFAWREAAAHHGWSRFDQDRPLYLEGRAVDVAWRNPHAEFVLERTEPARLPPDLAARRLPAQTAPVDGPALLQAARLPTRDDRRWTIELAPLSRMNAWQVAEIKPGDPVAVLGFTFAGEKGDAVLRCEYLWAGGGTYALRSSPA